MMEWNNKFAEINFPVDAFWMDIPYTDGNRYFIFDGKKFPSKEMNQMKYQIEANHRKFVVLTDPHIKID
jgi:alpha-glucosidase (family GH31 glycosyl hydrolase)